MGEAAGGQDDTYGSALEAHPGKSQGRPPTNTASRAIEQERPARPRLLQGAPIPDGRTVLTAQDVPSVPGAVPRHGRHPPPFIPVTNAIEALNRQLRKAIKTKGHFPNEDAARKLIYLAITNAVPAWTKTRNWTTALLAFKIHFEDRLPN
jgi:hypothetical protein